MIVTYTNVVPRQGLGIIPPAVTYTVGLAVPL
jgi:hypothetical protein